MVNVVEEVIKAAEILGMAEYDLIELYNSLGPAYLSMDNMKGSVKINSGFQTEACPGSGRVRPLKSDAGQTIIL